MARLSSRRTKLGVFALFVAIAAGVIAFPFVWVEIGTRRSTRCLAGYRAPRAGSPPSCVDAISWFVAPSRMPWTRTPGSYRAEELSARVAIEDYLDAAIGRPSHASLGRAGEALDRADKQMRAGSQRLELYELGPAVSAPNLGYYADLVNDRATLVAKAEQWVDWNVRLHALETALADGAFPRAEIIADYLAKMDPRDEDLRDAVAATFCFGSQPKRGLDLLERVQTDRAKDRHEGIARGFGDVRLTMVACAKKAGVEPPPKPENPEAGQADLPEARAVVRLADLADSKTEVEPLERREAALGVVGLLLETMRPVRFRAELLAALIASRHPFEAAEIAELTRPKPGEAPLLRSFTSAFDWLEVRRGPVPLPGGATFERAAERLAEIGGAADTAAGVKKELHDAELALLLEAARAHALEGNADRAFAAFERGASALDEGSQHVARAAAHYALHDRKAALAEVSLVGNGAPSKIARKAALVLRAEILASLGQRDDAARVADEADRDTASGDAALDARARWTRLALGKEPLRVALIDPPDLLRPLAWPSVALVGARAPWLSPDVEAEAPIDRSLAMWSAARDAEPKTKLAIRYALLEHRGDAPLARLAYLDVAAKLLPANEGDLEIWLDAFFAIEGRRLPMRTLAWTRAEAARWRGDREAQATWDARERTLNQAWAKQPMLASLLGM